MQIGRRLNIMFIYDNKDGNYSRRFPMINTEHTLNDTIDVCVYCGHTLKNIIEYSLECDNPLETVVILEEFFYDG